jgi:hypothetical protein
MSDYPTQTDAIRTHMEIALKESGEVVRAEILRDDSESPFLTIVRTTAGQLFVIGNLEHTYKNDFGQLDYAPLHEVAEFRRAA